MIVRKTTEELIVESLHELAAEIPVEKISVKDICDNCGISKSTFYNHFESILELRASTFQSSIIRQLGDPHDEGGFERHLTQYCRQFNELGPVIVNFNSDGSRNYSSLQFTTDLYSKALLDYALARSGKKTLPKEDKLAIRFYAHGIIACSIAWYKECGELTDAHRDALLACMPESARPYLM